MGLFIVFRSLTQEEIAQRRETARQRHADRMAAGQTAAESHGELSHMESTSQGGQPVGLSAGELVCQ